MKTTFFLKGPPGPAAGVYIQELSVTSFSCQLVWSVGIETDHGDPITSFDIEAESHYHPGQWSVILTGKIIFDVLIYFCTEMYQ